MQAVSLQSIVKTTTFKDFDIPNSALCRSLEPHMHGGIPGGSALLNANGPENKEVFTPSYVQAPQISKMPTAEAKNKEEKEGEKGGPKKILPLLGAIAGTILPVVILNKAKGKNLNTEVLKNGKMLEKLKEVGEYFEIEGVKGILSTAGGAIAGGLLGGVISDKDKENRKAKVKNAVFEMVNITVPTLFVVGTGKFLESAKSLKMNPALKKILPVALGVGLWAPVASKISGAINKKTFKEDKTKQRHFRPKDYIVHIDDIVTALALAKIPFLSAVPFDKILALIYILCGFEAGSSNAKGHGHGHHH